MNVDMGAQQNAEMPDNSGKISSLVGTAPPLVAKASKRHDFVMPFVWMGLATAMACIPIPIAAVLAHLVVGPHELYYEATYRYSPIQFAILFFGLTFVAFCILHARKKRISVYLSVLPLVALTILALWNLLAITSPVDTDGKPAMNHAYTPSRPIPYSDIKTTDKTPMLPRATPYVGIVFCFMAYRALRRCYTVDLPAASKDQEQHNLTPVIGLVVLLLVSCGPKSNTPSDVDTGKA